MKMKDLVHDFPLPIDFEQREHIGETVHAPVLQLEPNGSDRLHDVDTRDTALEFCRGAVLIVPIEESLDWTREEIRADVPEDSRIRMKSLLHLFRATSLATLDVILN